MERVDFIGVPGVGKSTLYKTLLRRRRRWRDRWLTPDEAKVVVARQLALRGGLKKKLTTPGLFVPHLQKILADHFTKTDAHNALRGNNELAVYLELWEKALASTVASTAKRARLLAHWVKWTEDLALLTQHLGNRVVVYDDSYSKLVCGWLGGLEASITHVAEFFRKGSVPAAIIWVKDPEPDRVTQRLIQRSERDHGRDTQGRLKFSNQWWREEELHVFVRNRVRFDLEAVRILREREVPVLEIEACYSLERQAETVEAFLREQDRE